MKSIRDFILADANPCRPVAYFLPTEIAPQWTDYSFRKHGRFILKSCEKVQNINHSSKIRHQNDFISWRKDQFQSEAAEKSVRCNDRPLR